jgi:hypothetical protein
MLQRIQTLLLIIVFGAGLAAFFFPIANFFSSQLYTIELGVFGVKEYTEYGIDYPDTILLPIVLGLVTLIAFVTIFLYKRRMVQVRLIRFNMLLNIVYLGLVFFFYVPELEKLTQVSADYVNEPGIYLSIVAVVFLFLSSRFIMRDEKLIRSTNRLR